MGKWSVNTVSHIAKRLCRKESKIDLFDFSGLRGLTTSMNFGSRFAGILGFQAVQIEQGLK